MARRRSLVPALFAAAAAALVAGCSSTSSSSAGGVSLITTLARAGVSTAPIGPLEKTDLVVAAVPTTDSTGFYVALREGLFAKEGLHVKAEMAQSAEEVINQQALNQIDVTAGNYVSYIEAQENWDHGMQPAMNNPNPSPQQIASNLDIFDEASVMNPGFVGLFVPTGSPIKTLADLKGKTIGINAPGNVAYLMVAAVLQANGISPSSVKFAYYPFPVMEKQLLAGKVQVAFLAEPFISIAEQTAGLTELTNLDEGLTMNFPVEGYAVTKAWAQANPNTLLAFQRALEEGQEIADTNREAAEQAMEAEVQGITPQFAALLTMENYPIGSVDVDRLQRVADDMQQFGLISGGVFNVKQMIGLGATNSAAG
jgi:NitT/TauT family transport system substrate-binding protein